MSSITQYGFERDDYQTILEDIKERFRAELGYDVGLEDYNVLGQLAAIVAKLQNDNVKLLEAMWGSQKIDAAEGIYLDDILGRLGVFRRGKQKGTGIVYLEIDNTCPDNYTVPITTQIQATNNQNYVPQSAYLLSSYIRGFILTTAQIAAGQYYETTITNTVDQVQYTFSYTPADDTDKLAMLNSLGSFIRQHMPGNNDRVYVSGTTLYAGYDVSQNFIGLTESTQFSIDPIIGNRFSAIPVIAETAGYFPLDVGEVSTISPTFTGFVSADNLLAFYAGSEVETDSEYKLRYYQEIRRTKTGTRESILSSVIAVDGVSKVRVYDNPTLTNRTEAAAKTFHVITVGGVTADISQAIYDSKPINTLTTGSISYDITASDGGSETIKHSKATQVPIDIRIRYSTKTGNPLTSFEQTEITNKLVECVGELNIGETQYNTRLVFCALSSSASSGLTSAIVEVKLSSEASTLYRTSDIVPTYNQILTLDATAVTYSQEV